MKNVDRRSFLKLSGLTALPALLPMTAFADEQLLPQEKYVRFSGDGELGRAPRTPHYFTIIDILYQNE